MKENPDCEGFEIANGEMLNQENKVD